MAGDDETFIIDIESEIEALLILIEAYKANVITKQELLSALIDLLYQD